MGISIYHSWNDGKPRNLMGTPNCHRRDDDQQMKYRGGQLLSGNLGQENGPLLCDLPMKYGDVSWATLQ